MFTTPCILHKNTWNIRGELNELGYKEHPYNMPECDDTCIITQVRDDDVLINRISSLDKSYPCYFTMDEVELSFCKHNTFDCGNNEELFLAIAALRDDSDKDQWFVHNLSKQFMPCIHDEFHCCAMILGKDNEYLGYEDRKDEFHKATVEELIEHFKKK